MSRFGFRASGKRLFELAVMLVATFALLTAAGLVINYKDFHNFALAESKGLDGDEMDALENQNRAFERIASAVTPAIVNIQTTQVVKLQQSPFFNDPFFRQFFGNSFGGGSTNIPREQREHSLGSGVIVSPDGYVITNNHVVAKANDIQVMLSDKRVFKGKVLGADPQTDVAVVKIEGKDLPVASWGDSSSLRVGDIVLAFGNPFGLNFTVTRGIVSAIGRSGLGIEEFEDFIQTDAAINPGNSGGALVDVRGRVVGINTAIMGSPGGGFRGEAGFNGVGLAIPADIARHVLESLIKTGRVERGFLGVTVSPLSDQLAHQFRVPDVSGALVQDVTAGGPADQAGIQQGDVIRSIDGKTVDSSGQLTSTIVGLSPGAEVKLGIIRDGQPREVRVSLGSRPVEKAANEVTDDQTSAGTLRGITVQSSTPDLNQELGLPKGSQGVVISNLDPSSPAAQAGLQQGDLIESIDRQTVKTPADFNRLAERAKGQVLLRIHRKSNGFFIVVSAE